MPMEEKRRRATPAQRADIDRHFRNIEVTALADLDTLASHGGGMGVFFLATPIIDALAQAFTHQDHYWKTYIHAFMPRLEPLADRLYQEFRNPGAHNLSASSSFLFTSTEANRGLHMAEFGGHWFLHAGEFARDTHEGFQKFWRRAHAERDLAARVLKWFEDGHAPVGPVTSDVRATLFNYQGATSLSATGGSVVVKPPAGTNTTSGD